MSIRARIIGAVVLVVAAVNVGYTVYLVTQGRRDLVAQLRAKVADNDRLLGLVTAGPLYDGDIQQLNVSLGSFFDDPEMLRIELRERDGDIHITRERQPDEVPGETIASRVSVVRGPDTLGEIRTLYSTAVIERRLRSQQTQLLLVALGSILILSGVIYVTARGLTRPIERLTVAAQAMAAGDLEQTLRSEGPWEVAILRDSFVRMRDVIRTRMTELTATNDRLRAEVTQRREAEEGRERLVSILEATPDFVGIAEPTGDILYINAAGRAMTGIAEDAVLGLPLERLHPRWAAELIVRKGLPAAVERGRWTGDAALLGADGREIPVSAVILSHRDGEGRIRYVSTVMRDISDRLESEAADRRLASIVRYSRDFIAQADPSGRLQFVNEYGLGLLGASLANELGELRLESMVHPTSEAVFTREVLPALARTGRWSGEFNLRHFVTGDPIPVQSEVFRIEDASGRPLHIATVSRDVRESRRAEAAIKTSEERMRQAVRVAQIGIYDHDQRSGSIYWSPRQREIYGIGNDEAVTRNLFLQHLHPEDHGLVEAAVRRAHDPSGDGSFEIEHRIIRNDGEVRWLSTRGRTQFEGEADARRPVRSVAAVLDVSDRRAAEEQRASLQSQLAHAQKLETVGRLAGGVAHDFNNMLHVIMGFAEILELRLVEDPVLSAHVAEIRRAARRAQEVTRQLLAFSRRQLMSPVPSDLNTLIAGTAGALARLIGEDIELRVVGDKDLWTVNIDPAQVDQILINLAVNARDAMPDGGKLTIETANVHFDEAYCRSHVGATPGEYVLVAVSDDGIGMDDETLSHMFEPFFTTKPTGKGTGLGLATVYGIVEQNKGFLNVYSEPGRGTTFKIYLPRSLGEPTVQAAEESAEQTGTGRVLVVEDEAAVRRLTVAILESIGYSVVAASSPAEAIELCERSGREFDVVLTDVVMPGMSGKELRDRLETLRPGIKVIFTSGYTANVIAHHGILEPGVHFIAKPFGVTELAGKLREVMASK